MTEYWSKLFLDAYVRRDELPMIGRGTYNSNYRFRIPGFDFVIRVPRHVRKFDLISMKEATVLNLLEELEFTPAPRLFYVSTSPRFMVLDYFHGETLSLQADLRKALAILRDLHELEIPKPFIPSSSESLAAKIRIFTKMQMDNYSAILNIHRPSLADRLAEDVDGVPFPKKRQDRLLHGDPTRANFLIGPNGMPHLIDFELAAIGDPLLDFALLLNRAFPADPLAMETVLHIATTSYATCGDRAQAADLLGYAIVDVARSIHVVAAKFLVPSSPLYDPRRGENRLNELLRHRALLTSKRASV